MVAGLVVLNKDLKKTVEQVYTPDHIEIANVPGMGTATVRWIVSGNKEYTIKVSSAKGGVASWNK